MVEHIHIVEYIQLAVRLLEPIQKNSNSLHIETTIISLMLTWFPGIATINKMMRYLLNNSTADHHLYSRLYGLAKASDKSKDHFLYSIWT